MAMSCFVFFCLKQADVCSIYERYLLREIEVYKADLEYKKWNTKTGKHHIGSYVGLSLF